MVIAAQSTYVIPFHLAIQVNDLAEARAFYGEQLGCTEGRSSLEWVDFNFFGHQLVTHLVPEYPRAYAQNDVAGDHVPVPHFGTVLSMQDWQSLAGRLTAGGMKFVVQPHVRFAGQVGEQATMFLLDPSGNALEFKAFRNPERLFAK